MSIWLDWYLGVRHRPPDDHLETLPFEVESIQTENGSEFQCSVHWRVLDRGLGTSTSSRSPRGSRQGREITPHPCCGVLSWAQGPDD
jgi:hypothetical protein